MKRFTFAPAVLGAAIVAVSLTTAHAQGQGPDRAQVMADIAGSLNVSQDALMSCLPERPERSADGQSTDKGERPNRPRPNFEEISACLTDGGTAVSAEQVQAAFEEHGPKRRK